MVIYLAAFAVDFGTSKLEEYDERREMSKYTKFRHSLSSFLYLINKQILRLWPGIQGHN
jgi:hypothetical protein